MTCPHCGYPQPPAVCATCETPIHNPLPSAPLIPLALLNPPPVPPSAFSERVHVPIGVPAYHLYQPPPDWRKVRPIRGLRNAVLVVSVLWIAADVALFLVGQERLPAIRAELEPLLVDPVWDGTFDVRSFFADNWSLFASALVWMLVATVQAVVGLAWTFRARANAEVLAPYEHRRNKLWIVLGWVVPPFFLWFPKQIVEDIWQTSDPKSPDRDPMVRARSRALVNAWWLVVLTIYTLIGLIVGLMAAPELTSELQDGLHLLFVAACVLQVVIVWLISTLQERQRREREAG